MQDIHEISYMAKQHYEDAKRAGELFKVMCISVLVGFSLGVLFVMFLISCFI
jgi:hypothetical protein